MFVYYNPNPVAARVGDCAVRAVSKAVGCDWLTAYLKLCIYGILQSDLPSANSVWGRMLKDNGFRRRVIPDSKCGYTVSDFLRDNPKGVYVLALNGHVVCCEDGNYYDTWDSGKETAVYYWSKEATR